MRMTELLGGLAALPLVAGVAMADQPAPLDDAQMDRVTAGLLVSYTPIIANLCTGMPATCSPVSGSLTLSYPVSDAGTGLASLNITITSTIPGFPTNLASSF
jgi:hypothetical protein